MAPWLEVCPPEIIESITILLEDITDVCSLRLTSRTLAWNSATEGGRYRTLFKAARVDMTERRLNAFIELTRTGQLGCFVGDLTIFGVVVDDRNQKEKSRHRIGEGYKDQSEGIDIRDTYETRRDLKVRRRRGLRLRRRKNAEYKQLRDSGKGAALLSQAFHNLKENAKRGSLGSLSLQNLTISEREDFTFRTVFEFCTSEEASLQALSLNRLLEDNGSDILLPLRFDESGRPDISSTEEGDPVDVQTLKRVGADIKRAIVYGLPPWDVYPAAVERNTWQAKNRMEYGPPCGHPGF